MEAKFIGTAEAAKLLGITQQMVRVAARAGRIKAYHPYEGCRKFVFNENELRGGIVSAEDL